MSGKVDALVPFVGPAHVTTLSARLPVYLDAYLAASGIDDTETPLFQSLYEGHKLTGEAISRRDMARMAKTRCIAAGCRRPSATTRSEAPT
jgi:hypothetical protein